MVRLETSGSDEMTQPKKSRDNVRVKASEKAREDKEKKRKEEN